VACLRPDRERGFTQNGADLATSFNALGICARLRLLEPGVPNMIELGC
jgi:hypothetical protein